MAAEDLAELRRIEQKIDLLTAAVRADIEALDERIDMRFISSDKALLLEQREISRRLELLNGEAERLRSMQATYLPREVWENFEKNDLRDLKTFRNMSLGRHSVLTVIVATITSVGFLIVSYLLSGQGGK